MKTLATWLPLIIFFCRSFKGISSIIYDTQCLRQWIDNSITIVGLKYNYPLITHLLVLFRLFETLAFWFVHLIGAQNVKSWVWNWLLKVPEK
jgi:hypothetical protein